MIREFPTRAARASRVPFARIPRLAPRLASSLILGLAPASAAALLAAPAARAQQAAQFTQEQADSGAALYVAQCAACHGPDGDGASIGPALHGADFLSRWGGAPLDEVFGYLRASMPPGASGSLAAEAHADILAFLMRLNGAGAGDAPMPADPAQLAAMSAPAAPRPARRGGAPAGLAGLEGLEGPSEAPPAPRWPDRFAGFTPVTDAVLTDPPPGDWPGWRRGHKAQGFSPLDQITAENVGGLRQAWVQTLPMGPNMNEPLARDGVLFVHAYGDEVFALDGATGRVLWRYRRHAPEGAPQASKKTMALYGDRLYVATADIHMVALDARTGRPIWDRPITDRPGVRLPGGPLAADGVIMIGTTTQAARGGAIIGMDAGTGEHLWLFNTVAQPDEPGGDTWNGLSADERSGGSSWTSGSYDAVSGLAYWGTGPTYDTGPLRVLREGENNDALYTDVTLALEPRTGRLAWHYQHMKNDQWDLDWVFERTVADIEIGGRMRHVVITGGKPGVFDTLDAATGQYLGSIDMGMQNFITRIDPLTGEKTYDPALIPGGGNGAMRVCPNGGGGRNWPPTSFDPRTGRLVVTARDICMDLIPTQDGGGFLSTGVSLRTAPSPRSAQDGMFGVVQMLDMQAGQAGWERRQRAIPSTGALITAGGVVFVGAIDRTLAALDLETGDRLWSGSLIDGPTGAPIAYTADGKQYVAMVVGRGNPLAGANAMTPEIEAAPVGGAAIAVFALPD